METEEKVIYTGSRSHTPNAIVSLDSIKNNRDLAFSNQSLVPYGNGDGGGGPQRAMLERIRRMSDIVGDSGTGLAFRPDNGLSRETSHRDTFIQIGWSSQVSDGRH